MRSCEPEISTTEHGRSVDETLPFFSNFNHLLQKCICKGLCGIGQYPHKRYCLRNYLFMNLFYYLCCFTKGCLDEADASCKVGVFGGNLFSKHLWKSGCNGFEVGLESEVL